MKKLLFVFFQVLCLLQFAQGQLNAHPADDSINTASVIAHLKSSAHIDFFAKDLNNPDLHINTSIPNHKIFRVLNENTTEVEFEVISLKKCDDGTHYFITAFYDQSPEYVCLNAKNSLAVCRQLSFIPADKKHIRFQVFRI